MTNIWKKRERADRSLCYAIISATENCQNTFKKNSKNLLTYHVLHDIIWTVKRGEHLKEDTKMNAMKMMRNVSIETVNSATRVTLEDAINLFGIVEVEGEKYVICSKRRDGWAYGIKVADLEDVEEGVVDRYFVDFDSEGNAVSAERCDEEEATEIFEAYTYNGDDDRDFTCRGVEFDNKDVVIEKIREAGRRVCNETVTAFGIIVSREMLENDRSI